MIYHAWIKTPLGQMLIAATEADLLGAWFKGQKHFPAITNNWREFSAHPTLRQAAGQLREYFIGQRKTFDLPLSPAGTRFRRNVWQALQQISFGETSTYGTIALAMKIPGAARSIGIAIGHNPLSVIVPCHRVLGADGSLTGYAGGLARKRQLLALERSARNRWVPTV